MDHKIQSEKENEARVVCMDQITEESSLNKFTLGNIVNFALGGMDCE